MVKGVAMTVKTMIDPQYMTPALWLLLALFTAAPFAYLIVMINMRRTRARYERMKREAEKARRRHRNRL